MTGSAKSPDPRFGSALGSEYNLRGFRPEDMMYLVDIDAKCGDIPWSYEQWMQKVHNHTGSVVTFYGTPVGFAMFQRMGEYVELVKIAVKSQYRRQHLGVLLMSGCFRFAQDMGCHTIFTVMPETYLPRPGEPGEPAVKFFPACGFAAAKGMLRDYYHFDGRSIDGVKFVQTIARTTPERGDLTNDIST